MKRCGLLCHKMRSRNAGKFLVAILIAFMIMLGGFDVYAYVIMNPSFRIESEDGSKVLVFDSRRRPIMGVYHNTEPLQLIYRVPIDQNIWPIGIVASECLQYKAL